MVGDRPVVELHQRWVMSTDLEPAWTTENGYVIEVDGDPKVHLKVDIWPAGDLADLTTEGIHEIGMRITGLPAVNAIAAVCAAAPGIRTYADLPVVTGRLTR